MNVIWAEHERIHKGVCGSKCFRKDVYFRLQMERKHLVLLQETFARHFARKKECD